MSQAVMVFDKVYVSLTVFRTVHVVDGKELVVTCQYATDGRLGYFVCKEDRFYEEGTNVPMWEYTDVEAFFQKTDETSYQQAVAFAKTLDPENQ